MGAAVRLLEGQIRKTFATGAAEVRISYHLEADVAIPARREMRQARRRSTAAQVPAPGVGSELARLF